MDYKELLEHSFAIVNSEYPSESRLEYLADNIFDFTTYDSGMSELFAAKAVEVCAAINDGKTFDYIEGAENYRWYLLMCNMPFFADKLEWGSSIRGAWWGASPGKQIELQSCGIWIGSEQWADPMMFGHEEWEKFIAAVIEFAAPELVGIIGGG